MSKSKSKSKSMKTIIAFLIKELNIDVEQLSSMVGVTKKSLFEYEKLKADKIESGSKPERLLHLFNAINYIIQVRPEYTKRERYCLLNNGIITYDEEAYDNDPEGVEGQISLNGYLQCLDEGEQWTLEVDEAIEEFEEYNAVWEKEHQEKIKKQNKLKMYILIKDTCPDDLAPLIAAHTSMGTYLKFKNLKLMAEWATSPHFKKVVCRVSEKAFEKAKKQGEHVCITESHNEHLGEIGMGFNIQENYPVFLRSLPLWKVK